MKLPLIILIILLSTFCSCGIEPLTSKTAAKEMDELVLFEPLSHICTVEKGNTASYNDSLSTLSVESLKLAAIDLREKIRLKDVIHYENEYIQQRADFEISHLIVIALKENKIKGLPITPILDSLLEIRKKRFGIVAVSTGFIRTEQNSFGQHMKNGLLRLASLGRVKITSHESYTDLFVMIVDAKENNIAFFDNSYQAEYKATNQKSMKKLLERVFEGYLFHYPQASN